MSATSKPVRCADWQANLRKSRNSAAKTGSNWTTKDISVFAVTFVLVLLGTAFAAATDQPVFWLLLVPAPLAIGFTVVTFLRERRRGRKSLSAMPKETHRGGTGDSGKLSSGGPDRSKEQRWTMTVPGF
jgi:hypothetical protein